MSFLYIYYVAFEVCKIAVPSALAFLAWYQGKNNQKSIDSVQRNVTSVENRVQGTQVHVVELNEGVKELRIVVNSRLSELLKLTENSAFARGLLESKENQINPNVNKPEKREPK